MYKRKSLVMLVILLAGAMGRFVPVSAQDNPVIVLNDATPSVNVLISPNNGAQGVVYIELDGVSVTLRDEKNTELLALRDPRVKSFSLQLATGAQTHLLHIERLPGLTEARALVAAQSTLPEVKATVLTSPVSALAEPAVIQTNAAPAFSIPVAVTENADMISAQFPPEDSTLQLTATDGSTIFTLQTGKQINGISVRLSPGAYAFAFANIDTSKTTDVQIALSTAPTALMEASLPVQACVAKVDAASVNLRSGPGTAYSVLGYTTRGSELPVGGVNKEGGWLLVESSAGGAWAAQSLMTADGDCTNLTVYDIPVRNASKQPVVVIAPPPSVSGGNPASAPSVATSEPREGDDRGRDDDGEDD